MVDGFAAHRGQSYVIKLGGEIMQHAAALDALAADVVALTQGGVRVALVHGGGPQADALAAQLGHTVRKVAGRRVTDDDALAVAKWVYGGSINVELLGALKRHGGRAVGLSGVDGDLITVQRRPLVTVRAADGSAEQVDFGHVGDVTAVDGALIETLWAGCYIPVVASLAADPGGAIYNVNADTIATALAVALAATGLLLLTNVPGILRDRTDSASLVTQADAATIQALIADGTIAGGMLPKVQNALDALTAGVAQVQILDGTQSHCLRDSFLHAGLGTTIHPTDLTPLTPFLQRKREFTK
ncbi:MAG: acetylglutamate kinase [Chloroflexota bacterium]|nr:acetylglutamate kinase [Chloroflexota bacterium]